MDRYQMIIASLRHCLTSLLQFNGRDRPSQFWPWAALVLAVAFGIWMTAFFAQLAEMGPKIDKIAREHPEQVRIEQGPGHYSVQIEGYHPELMPDFASLTNAMTGIVAVCAVLLAAAIVRRLHDSDMRGWIAIIPLGLLVSGLAVMNRMFSTLGRDSGPDMQLFAIAMANNLAYLATLGGLVYLLIRKGTAGPNRFGDPPA